MHRLRHLSASRWTTLAILCLMAILVAAWRMEICPIFDDHHFRRMVLPPDVEDFWEMRGPLITTWCELADTLVNHWLIVNGRLANLLHVSTVFMPQWLLSSLQGLTVALSVMFMAIAAAGRRVMRCPWLVAAVALLIWKWLPWNDCMVSAAYFANYAGSGLLTLAYALLFLSRRRMSLPLLVCAALLALCAGWMHEGFSIPLCAASALILVIDRRERPRRILMLVMLAAGTALVALDPATLHRIDQQAAEKWAHISYLTSFILIVTRFYWLYIYALLLIAGAVVRRDSRFILRSLRDDIFWLTVAIVSLMVAVGVHGGGRVTWPAAMATLILCVRCVWRISPAIHRPRKGLAVAIAAVLTIFFVQLITWQHRISGPQRQLLADIVEAPIPVAYADLIPQEELPWYLFGIPRQFELTFRTHLMTQLRPDARAYRDIAPLVLPVRYRGLSFPQWDKLPGDNPFRGSMPWIYSPDSIPDGTPLRLRLGSTLPSASPPARLMTRLRPVDEATATVTDCLPCIAAGGDTLWLLRLDLPRMATYRHIDAISVPD